jgi:lysozyme family protein
MSNYDRAFTILVGEEGGYVNNPNDPGGETNWGIIWATLKLAISKSLVPADTTIKSLTQGQSKIIYKTLYWDVIKGDQLKWPLCLYMFDAAVNQGCDDKSGFAAQKMLQRALGVAQDGILGDSTMLAAEKADHWLCARYMAYRNLRYTGTRNFDKFGVGWFTRCFDVAFKAGQSNQN